MTKSGHYDATLNELWGVDPRACSNHEQWRFVFDKFGPLAGRYISQAPAGWIEDAVSAAHELLPPHSAEVATLIRRALEEKKLLRLRQPVRFNSSKSWKASVMSCADLYKSLDRRLLCQPGEAEGKFYDYTTFNPPPICGGQFETKKSEDFVALTDAILRISPELYFTDPYFDPLKRGHAEVMTAMLTVAFKSRCDSVDIWAARNHLMEEEDEDRARALQCIAQNSKSGGRPIVLHIVDKKQGTNIDSHDRCVFGIYGGIKFSKGFQLSSVVVDVTPMSAGTLAGYTKTYIYRENQFGETTLTAGRPMGRRTFKRQIADA